MTLPSIEHIWSKLWALRWDDPRLRFELGGGEFDIITQPVPRFLQAHRRASAVADALFRKNCIAVVAYREQAFRERGRAHGFEALHSTGFSTRLLSEWQAVLDPEEDAQDDEDYVWTMRSYDITGRKADRDTILWHAVALEMPIAPSAEIFAFLIDPDASVMLHVYDDRGMDVMAAQASALRNLYSTFADWLLDYDRERMRKLFEVS